MQITIKPEALKLLQDKADKGQTVLLALNDGSTKYSKVGGSCIVGANFQLVIINNG